MIKLVAKLVVLFATWLISATSFASEETQRVDVTAVKLREVLSLAKYQNIRSRLQNMSNSSVEVVLVLESKQPIREVILETGDSQRSLSVAPNGEILLSSLKEIVGSDGALILVPKAAADAKVTPRLRINLPNGVGITYSEVVRAVSAYEAAAKELYGWASFLVPKLDCLTLEFPSNEKSRVAYLVLDNAATTQLSPNAAGRVDINLREKFEELDIVTPPKWIWGCNFSRREKSGEDAQ